MKPPAEISVGTAGAAPLRLIRSYHRRVRLSLLLWALAAILTAFVAVEAETLGWWREGFLFGFGFAILTAALVIVWLHRFSSRSETETVRALDALWATQARLESTLELAQNDSLLAASLREETARRVKDKKPPFGRLWFSVLSIIGLMGLVLVGEFGIRLLHSRAPSQVVAAQKAPEGRDANHASSTKSADADKSSPAKSALDTFAEIKWISPEAKSRATAIEEIRLKAAVETRSGLRNVGLEISINGGPPATLRINDAAGAKVSRPGAHEMDQAIYLDELSVKEYDVISYFMRADPVGENAVAITSPLQFIQIRAAHEEVRNGSKDGNDASEIAASLYRLQSEQLDLLQQDFLLAKARVAHSDNFWQQTNRAVAAQQAGLSGRVTELRTLVIDQAGPAKMVDNLGQASTLMTQAAGRIKAEENSAAVTVQQQALALLADCDRLFRKTLTGPPPKEIASDPFRDKQKYTLPDRSQTPAGELEALAQKQEQILSELATVAGLSGGSVSGSTVENEDALARDAARLGGGAGFSENARQAARRAADEAKTAAQRMAAGDAKGAVTPATAAAQALHDAIREQETVGRWEALAALEAARRELNAVARLPDQDARNVRLAAITADLGRAADLQQRIGLAEAARQLAVVANGTRLLGPAAPGSDAWIGGIRQAAAAQAVVATRRDAIRRAARQLARGKLALARNDDFSGRDEVELAAQMARELFPEATMQATARKLEVAAAARGEAAENRATLVALCEDVERALLKLRSEGERDERVRRFNPNEIDPAYRPSVEEYFERLSREGTQR